MSDNLHIISFNVPYPPDYGGIIDVYYKLKALYAAGIKVHLHCFTYGRKESEELEKICTSVTYYNRKPLWKGFFSNKPLIVDARRSKSLLNNLLKDNYPILFEGLHTCYYLDNALLKDRIRMVRMHNNEAVYYLSLARREKKFFNSLYYYEEYKRLKLFENKLAHATYILAIARHEAAYYQTRFPNTIYIGPFHGNNQVSSLTGKGKYALYHGNLNISENIEAALFLLEQIFNDVDLPLIIAGMNPPEILLNKIAAMPHVTIINSPSPIEMLELIKNAQVNILPSFQHTGIKLKLLNSLFNGRFCIANQIMIDQTQLEKYCKVANTPHEMKNALHTFFEKEFTAMDLQFRKTIESEFSDKSEAIGIIELMQQNQQN